MLNQTDPFRIRAEMQRHGTAQCSIWIAKISGEGLDELSPDPLT